MNKLDPEMQDVRVKVVKTGRACVRIVEAADVLLEGRPVWTEKLLLWLVRSLYRHRLRGLVASLPAEVTGEILAASEKIIGPVKGFSQN